MSMLTLLLLPLLAAPPASDRSVDPVAIEAPPAPPPAEAAPAEPTPATGDPSTIPPPASPAPAPSPVVQPQPYTALPTPPPPPARKQPDRPIRWRVDVLGTIGGAIHRDPAWRAFDDDRRVTQLGGGVRADFRLASGRVFLGGGVTYRRFAARGTVHDTLSTRTLVREPIAFVRASVVTVEGIDAFVQAGGGPSIIDLDLSSTQRATQRSVVGMIDGLAGLAVYLPKRWLPRRGASRLTAGLELAAGYTWRGNVDVRPTLAQPEDPIAADTTAFGDVAIRGFAWRLGLFVRFQ